MLEELLKKEVEIIAFVPFSTAQTGIQGWKYFGKVIGVNEEYLILECYASEMNEYRIIFKKKTSNIDRSKPVKTYLRRTFIASIEVKEEFNKY